MAMDEDVVTRYPDGFESAAQAADYKEDGASWRGSGFRGGLHSTPRVSYYFPQGVGHYHFGERHPMKPHRLELTNHLVAGYDLFRMMDVYTPRDATKDELEDFHGDDYVDFLSRVTPENVQQFTNVLNKYNIGDDCPVFDGLYEYCRQYSGASLAAARKLASGQTDIAINWTGGLHHAKKYEASGFCYVNDIVLAILQLLRVHARVLYIDIDIHHGDGVQEAFYNSNRVLTVSFHKFSESFFPGTGHIDEIGNEVGKYFSLNVPLQDGIDDESYVALFKSIMEPTMTTFRPSVVVLQCGADSLGCDRLGCFNLSISAHGECVRFIKAFGIPLLVLGGGGYTIRNVSRCWTYETAVLLDAQHTISNSLPATPYDAFFSPDYKLHPPITGRVDNVNTRQSLERIRRGVLERLRFMHGAPSVAMQAIPPDIAPWLADQDNFSDDQDGEDEDENDKMDHLYEPVWSWSSSGASANATSSNRKDRHKAKSEYYSSRKDQDATPASRKAKASSKYLSSPLVNSSSGPNNSNNVPGSAGLTTNTMTTTTAASSSSSLTSTIGGADTLDNAPPAKRRTSSGKSRQSKQQQQRQQQQSLSSAQASPLLQPQIMQQPNTSTAASSPSQIDPIESNSPPQSIPQPAPQQ